MSTLFVTGGTGLSGANVCEQLIARGDTVHALVRNPAEAAALEAIGVKLVQGDIANLKDVIKASEGCDSAIHCAALLGGSSQNFDDFQAVNYVGTINVMDAAKENGMKRVVALSTGTFLDLTTSASYEESPILNNPPDDPYTVTKLAAFKEVQRRAGLGENVVTCHPGAIYGPGLVTDRALHPTSFNRVLLAAMRGKIKAYLSFPVIWVAARDIAWGSISALDNGIAGERYWLAGRPEDAVSTAAGCNLACEIAGVPFRIEDVDYRNVTPEQAALFGPTLMAIAEGAAKGALSPRPSDNLTSQRLGYHPMSFEEGLRLMVPWLRKVGRLL